ncbi:hypothetical protein P8X24_01935 [Pyrococcus kukulkanii]|uniref:hypothetical protein n=1 Tax=Pyrococcus kukulkanii TaxID=1609559 RepID=UPI0035614909
MLSVENSLKAIETVRNALKLFTPGPVIVHRTPEGIHVDVPVLYMDFAVDRVHFDPSTMRPSPKGNPVHSQVQVAEDEIRKRMEEILKEVWVVEACEYRKPERCWIVPVAWKSFIIMHVRVSADGEKIVPDYPLTEEIRRHIVRY